MQSRRYFLTAVAGAALAAPALMRADDHDHHDRDRAERYYDHDAKQWHDWDEGQDRAYHRWWQENFRNRAFRAYNRLTDAEQRAYWHWWHEHEEHEEHERH